MNPNYYNPNYSRKHESRCLYFENTLLRNSKPFASRISVGRAEIPFFIYMYLYLSMIDDLSRDVPSIHHGATLPMNAVPSKRPLL